MRRAGQDLVDDLLARTDGLVEGMLGAMRGRPSYANVPEHEVRASVRRHVLRLTEHLRAGDGPMNPADEAWFRDVGEQRARQGVTVEDLVHVWKVTFDLLRAHVLQAVDLLADHPEVLRRLLRTTDELDHGLLAVVAGYQRARSDQDRAERERRGEVVRRLWTPGVDADEVRRTAETHGLDTTATFHPFRARPADERELLRLETWLDATHGAGVLHGLVDGDLCGVTSRPLSARCEHTIGVADAAPLAELPEASRLAGRALAVALHVGRPGVCRLADLGLLPAVLADDEVGAALDARYITPHVAQGPSGEAVLDTVEAYLSCQAKLAPAASALHVHLNTVRYRIARFEETTGVSLRDTDRLAEVWWALRRRRLLTP
ncbi:PucR family transcriptional regulator [Trujillonella humicola]|uniref:PucR family transcriptional regulator n=1 Tax=Trujillonella humicola TaxID=3383699 RepID=UPI003905DDA8